MVTRTTLKTLTCDEKDTVSIYKQQAKVVNPEIHHSNAEQEWPKREKQDRKRGSDAELLLSAACAQGSCTRNLILSATVWKGGTQ